MLIKGDSSSKCVISVATQSRYLPQQHYSGGEVKTQFTASVKRKKGQPTDGQIANVKTSAACLLAAVAPIGTVAYGGNGQLHPVKKKKKKKWFAEFFYHPRKVSSRGKFTVQLSV